jgi:hypothetical protein
MYFDELGKQRPFPVAKTGGFKQTPQDLSAGEVSP